MPELLRFPVLFRYDDEVVYQRFSGLFSDDFDILPCQSDQQALNYLEEHGKELCAVFLADDDMQQILESPLLQLMDRCYPQCLKVLLNKDIALDDIIALVGRQVVDKCFSEPYDRDLIRSLIYTSRMSLHETVGASIPQLAEPLRPIVLIVDDEQSATKYLRKQLERMQERFTILCAANAEEAMAIVREQQIAVIMSDQRMPGMRGDQLLNELRRSRPYIVRVLTSAYGEVDVALGAVNQGKIFRYQKKPWDAREVLACLEAALDEHQTLTQMHRDNRSYVETEFQRICSQRKAALTEALGTAVNHLGGEGTLQQFLGDMERIVVLPPNISHLRASADSDIEPQLVQGIQEEINRRVTKFEPMTDSLWAHSSTSVAKLLEKRYLEEEGEAGDIDGSDPGNLVGAELISSINLILSSSGLHKDELDFQLSRSDWVLTCGSKTPLKMFSHLMAPLTKVSRPLLQQQSALLMLYILCRRLGGTVELKEGAQSFSIRLSCPVAG